ncbi:unnamed protein product, partial [Symbiodinium sp. CCMP2456]
DLDHAGFGDLQDLPDISIDPEEKVLTAINDSDDRRCFCISLHASSIRFKGRRRLLAPGHARRDGESFPVIAFVLVLPPRTVLDVCKLLGPGSRDRQSGGRVPSWLRPLRALNGSGPLG